MADLRLLCTGDNHGNTTSLRRVVEQTEGEEFDYIVHVGDITNACLDGMDEGADQLSEVLPLFETLSDRGELVYVWGNRDFEVCSKGVGMRVDSYADLSFHRDTRSLRSRIEMDGRDFTQDPV